MSGVVHSINVCAEGGVPKHSVNAARIDVEGVEGDAVELPLGLLDEEVLDLPSVEDPQVIPVDDLTDLDRLSFVGVRNPLRNGY